MLCKDPVCRRHNRSLLGSSSTVIRNQEGASWEVAVSFQETQHNFTIQIPPDGGRLGGHHCYGVHCKTTFINKRDASLNFFLSFFFYTFKSRLWLRQVTKKKKTHWKSWGSTKGRKWNDFVLHHRWVPTASRATIPPDDFGSHRTNQSRQLMKERS